MKSRVFPKMTWGPDGSIRVTGPDLRTASGAGLFPGCVLEIPEPLEQLGTAIRHSLVHDVAVDNAQLLPDSRLDIGPQPDGRTRVQIWHFSQCFLPVGFLSRYGVLPRWPGTVWRLVFISSTSPRMCVRKALALFATPMAPLKSVSGLRSHRHHPRSRFGASARIQGNVMNSSLGDGCLTGSLSDFGSASCATTGSCNTVARWPATSLVSRTIRPDGNSSAS